MGVTTAADYLQNPCYGLDLIPLVPNPVLQMDWGQLGYLVGL